MSLFLLTVFVGNTFDAIITKASILNEFWNFIFFACLMLLSAFLFMLLAASYDVKDFSSEGKATHVARPDVEMSNNFGSDTIDNQTLLAQRMPV